MSLRFILILALASAFITLPTFASSKPEARLGLTTSRIKTTWVENSEHYYGEDWNLNGVGYSYGKNIQRLSGIELSWKGEFDFFPLSRWSNWRQYDGASIALRAAGSFEGEWSLHPRFKTSLGLTAGYTWALRLGSNSYSVPYQEAFSVSLITVGPTLQVTFPLPQGSPMKEMGVEFRAGMIELLVFTSNWIEYNPVPGDWSDHQITLWFDF